MSIEDKLIVDCFNDKEIVMRSSVLRKTHQWFDYDEQQALSHRNTLKYDNQNSILQGNDMSRYKGDELAKADERCSIQKNHPDAKKRSCMDKWFGKVKPGSMRASIFTIISSMIGVGFLTLPAIGKNNGYVIVVLFIILASSLSLFANIQLGIAFKITRRNNYALIVEEILGKVYSLILQFAIFFYVVASSIAYFMFGAIFSYAVFIDNEWIQDTKDNQDIFRAIFLSAAFLISFVGSIPAKLTALSYATMISSVIVFYIVILAVVDFFTLRDYFIANTIPEPEFPWIQMNMSIFSSYCLSLFSCVNQFAIINIISEQELPTTKRIKKTVTRAAIFPLFVYLMVGVIGYATYGTECPALIVQRAKLPGSSDVAMTIGRLLLVVCLITGIIIRSNSNQINLVNIIFRIRQLASKKKKVTSASVKRIKQSQDWKNSKKLSNALVAATNPSEAYLTSVQKPEVEKIKADQEIFEDNKAANIDDEFAPHDDGDNLDDNEIQECPEPTPFMRTFWRALMGIIPAVAANFLAQDVISVISKCSGLLAPPFVIIFPAMMTIKLRDEGKVEMSKCAYVSLWVFQIVFGVGSYVCVICDFINGSSGGA